MPLNGKSFHCSSTVLLDSSSGGSQTLKVVPLSRVAAILCGFTALCPLVIWGQSSQAPSSTYSGPAVMGRSMGAGPRPTGPMKIRFFASVRGTYDSGLTAVRFQPDGTPTKSGGYGYGGTAGLYGYKEWRRTQLMGGYIFGYQDYARRSNTGAGINQSITLGLTHQFSPRLTFQSSVRGSSLTRAYGFGYGFTRPGEEIDPVHDESMMDEVYDNRIYRVSNSNSLIYQLNARTQVAANGGAFLTKRTGGLVSVRGVFAGGDISRRITRTQTVSFNYNFSEYNYSGRYGNTVMQGVGLGWGTALGRRWELGLNGGISMVEIDSLRNVVLDPAIAAIIGQTQGTETFYRRSFYPIYQARLSGNFRRSVFTARYGQRITPGNGSFMTSRSENGGVAYSLTGIRKVNVTFLSGFNRLHNLMINSARGINYYAGVTAGYQLRSDLQFNVSVIGRRFESQATDFHRQGVRVAVGLSYSPGEVPLALW